MAHPLDTIVAFGKDYTIEGMTIQPSYELPLAIIPETQFTSHEGENNRSSAYQAILASVGLDSLTTSQETWYEGEHNMPNQTLGKYLMNTPTRRSAGSLVPLGQHRLSPRHGRIWKNKVNPP